MPNINKPNQHFDVITYTGNGSTNTITGLGFQPDLVWIKGRSGATDHALYDIVRGATKDIAINLTSAETTQSTGLTAFNSNGFTVGSLAKANTNAATYAAWCWKAGNSTSTNTAGAITSTVSVNPTAGFSIVKWNANGSANATIGHGLNVKPKFIIYKAISGTSDMAPYVWTSALDGTEDYIRLNSTSAKTDVPAGNGAPTSTTISNWSYLSPDPIIAYCWSEVTGFSSFGSYTGNGNANGPFINLGFRPALVIIKCSSAVANWVMFDDRRNGYNVDNNGLFPNLANAENTTDYIDMLSNGFKIRANLADVNTNAATYIYAAWAENPFNYALGR